MIDQELQYPLFVALHSAFLGFSMLYMYELDRRGLCCDAVLFLSIDRHLRSQSPWLVVTLSAIVS